MKKILHVTFAILLVSTLRCEQLYPQEPGMFQIVGFASENGGTTGGDGGEIITVYTGTDLQNALIEKKNNSNPLIIYVEGIINLANSQELSKIDVKEVEDVSIIGTGSGAEFDGIGIKIWKSSNIILRNLKIHHVLSGEKDCIGIEGPTDHVWIDHCELYNEFQGVEKDYYDGLIDAKAEAEYITYSWNFLHDSWKTCLVGSSESDTYDRKLTMHHNYFLNCNSRIPLFRGSTGHFFNNYYKDIASTTINSRINACVLIENNYFENAMNPWVSAYSDILGGGDTIGNILINSPFQYSDNTHELPFCSPVIPYEYSSVLNEATDVPALVLAHAGVGKLATGNESFFVAPFIDKSDIGILNVYPNPASGKVLISFHSEDSQAFMISIVCLSGMRYIIFQGSYNNRGIQTIEADLSSFQSGLYLLEMISDSERSVRKLMICNKQHGK
jgi:pectate lyase